MTDGDENGELTRINSLAKETSSLNLENGAQQTTPAEKNNGQIIMDGLSKNHKTAENDRNSDAGSQLSQSSRSIVSSTAARGATKVNSSSQKN